MLDFSRLDFLKGRHALVDRIPFRLPVRCKPSPVLMAVFPIDYKKADVLLPAEVHPFRLWRKALLVVTVINYLETNIGKYVEYSIAIACTHGLKPAPRLLPGIFMRHYKTGQYVVDLPVSSEVSVKGGKGIWGMPKHQASLDFKISDEEVSSQYDLDGQLVTYIEIDRPSHTPWPLAMSAANYCSFRGLLMKSYIYFTGRMGFHLGRKARARLVIGDHPRARWLKELDVPDKPIATAFIPNAIGTLDDHFEAWFLSGRDGVTEAPEGLESIVDLGLSEEWLAPPKASVEKD